MRPSVSFVIVLSMLMGTGVAAQVPKPISPGGLENVVVVAGPCPTFSWTAVAAESVELVVYRLPQKDSQQGPERVMAVTLPGAADSWTPALGQCLEPATRYAWSVGTAGVWSEASLFEVSAAPSVIEVEQALAVLRRFVGEPEPATREPEVLEREVAEAASQRQPAQLEAEETAEREAATTAGAPVAPSATPSLVVDDEIHLANSSNFFRGGAPFLWTDGTGGSTIGSVALGLGALQATTGANNTAVGHTALFSNTTGTNNSAFGEDALGYNTIGEHNSAFGEDALRSNTSGNRNSAFGENALFSNTTGNVNSAFGYDALKSNSTGDFNSAFGRNALAANTAGSNSAFGENALYSNTTGGSNSAFGKGALPDNTTGSRNSAFGKRAMRYNTTGEQNTAVGNLALRHSRDGDRNVAIGSYAGGGLFYGSDNIFISDYGLPFDNDTIRIGKQAIHTQTFIAGIRGATTDVDNGVTVLIDSEGQLGTVSSSRRSKQAIRDMGDASTRLLDLRPVTFQLRQAFADGSRPTQFGLIAEEVAEVLPELVVNDAEGHPETVKYHLLSSLLLNELQKQHRQLRVQWFLIGSMLLTGLALAVGRWRFG